MPDIFYTSDTHFTDKKAWNGRYDPKTLEEFFSVEERDETIIQRWNSVVKPGDRVYHAGDVGFDKDTLGPILARLNGKKRLLLGNHDHIERFPCLLEHFKKTFLYRDFGAFVVSHMPIPESLLKRRQISVHGHTHREIHRQTGQSVRYLNICTENTNYTPVHFDTIMAYIEKECRFD